MTSIRSRVSPSSSWEDPGAVRDRERRSAASGRRALRRERDHADSWSLVERLTRRRCGSGAGIVRPSRVAAVWLSTGVDRSDANCYANAFRRRAALVARLRLSAGLRPADVRSASAASRCWCSPRSPPSTWCARCATCSSPSPSASLLFHSLAPFVGRLVRWRVPRTLAAIVVMTAMLGGVSARSSGRSRMKPYRPCSRCPRPTKKLRAVVRGMRQQTGASLAQRVQQAAIELETTAKEAMGAAPPPRGVVRVQVEEPMLRGTDVLLGGARNITSSPAASCWCWSSRCSC